MSIVDPVSQLFLWLDRRNQPMHVGGVQVFKQPEQAPKDYIRQLVAHMRDQNNAIQPPFDRLLTYRLGQPVWHKIDSLDLSRHVRHLKLPEPGTFKQLQELVGELHANRLDFDRPPWEIGIIEGLEGHRFALYSKFHHSVMDGISAIRVLGRFLTTTPGVGHVLAPWQTGRPSQPGANDANPPSSRQSAYRRLAAIPGATRSLVQAWRDSREDADVTHPMQAPASLFNQAISGRRQWAARDYSLARIRELGRCHDATINDIVLALCATALRRYLADQQALPNKPLIALVPISLHPDDGHTGNRLGLLHANLATHLVSPTQRLQTTKRSVDYWKQHYRHMNSAQIQAAVAAMSAPTGLNLLSGIAPHRQAFNLVISNIPGPADKLFLGESTLESMFPAAMLYDGQALNICFISYRDRLQFGLIACPETVPGMDRILDYLDEAMDELEHFSSHRQTQSPEGH